MKGPRTLSMYYGFAGAGDINRAGAVALLDSTLPQDDVEIVVPQTMTEPGLIELYNWLDVEFTGIETTQDIVGHLYTLAADGNKVTLILLRDKEHPEDDFLRAAFNKGIDVLDLNNSLHPIEWKPPEKTAPGRRRKAEPEHTPEQEQAYAEAEQEAAVEAEIAGPATKAPQWDERFGIPVTQTKLQSIASLEDELFGTLRELIRTVVAQEMETRMNMFPGVRATEQIGQSAPAVPEPAESEAPKTIPYLLNKETGLYTPREGKRGRPPKGTEVVYLDQEQIDGFTAQGLIKDDAPAELQLELPFD